MIIKDYELLELKTQIQNSIDEDINRGGLKMKFKIKIPRKTKKVCPLGHIYYTGKSGIVTINICPVCWEKNNK